MLAQTAQALPLTVGTAVEARFRGRQNYYPATVVAVHAESGRYDLEYRDDGREPGGWHALLRPNTG